MDDRQLLELAAKASGVIISTWSNAQAGGFQSQESAGGKFWNPLTDDGDAFRLATKLELMVDCHVGHAVAYGIPSESGFLTDTCPRRAIVRAAAALGAAL